MASSWADAWGTAWGDSWGVIGGGGPPSYIFKAQVVPVYVHPDPTAPGVVPVHHTGYVPGVTRVHTIDVAFIVAGCVPVRQVGSPGVGIVPVMEEP